MSSRRRRLRRTALWTAGVVGVLIFSIVGYYAFQLFSFAHDLKTSHIMGSFSKHSVKGDTNILIMGLDSRLDENGKPLPRDIYNALHAGDQSSGGQNSNVLIFLHIPGNGSKATAISIPRDDYAKFSGCPDGECHGKIKQAYGLAFDQESRALAGTHFADPAARVQKERDAGRRAEIATVSNFLGGVPIDHFIEVTMVAFFQVAKDVQPITVCLKQATQDSFSGAHFVKGRQQIDAKQALAFVRQRRDNVHLDLNFTDLDRSRRQQAFIASLAFQLRQVSTFLDPGRLTSILNVAKQNIAIDSGLNLLSLAGDASALAGGNLTFYTLPVDHFGRDSLGEDVNYVNLPVIQATVAHLINPTPKPTSPTAHPVFPSRLAVVNSSGKNGFARTVSTALARHSYRSGALTTGGQQAHSSLEYAPGEEVAARQLGATLGITTITAAALPTGELRLTLGRDFTLPARLGGQKSGSVAPAPVVSATGGGRAGPPVTALTSLSSGGIPCVK